jgi:nitroreductase
VRAALKLGDAERVVALIHLGPALSEPPEKERTPLEGILQFVP